MASVFIASVITLPLGSADVPGGVFQIIGLLGLLAVGGELSIALASRRGKAPPAISPADSDVDRLRRVGAL